MNDRQHDDSAIGRFDQQPASGVTGDQAPAPNLTVLYREGTLQEEARAAHLAKLTANLQPLLEEAEELATTLEALEAQHRSQIAAWRAIPWGALEDRGAPEQPTLWARAALTELDGIFNQASSLRSLRRHGEDLAATLALDQHGPENMCATIESKVKHAREYEASIARKISGLEDWIGQIVRWAESHPEGRR